MQNNASAIGGLYTKTWLLADTQTWTSARLSSNYLGNECAASKL